MVPAMVAGLGEAAVLRVIGFYTAAVRNPNSRAACAVACGEENARRKNLSGRRRIKPRGMEDAGEPKLAGKWAKHRRRRKIVPRVATEDRVIKAQVPPGSRFKGYETYVVQDIVLHAEAIRYRRLDGTMVLAPLPASVVGHFGLELHRLGALTAILLNRLWTYQGKHPISC
jgi:hypothetical protein